LEDMCYERRRAEACVDQADCVCLLTAGPIMLTIMHYIAVVAVDGIIFLRSKFDLRTLLKFPPAHTPRSDGEVTVQS